MTSYKDLTVWQKSIELCIGIYEVTENFPKSELYGLTSQMKRCSVAIPSNIAEGQRRGHKPEFIQFLRIAYGSGAELETQVEIAKLLSFSKNLDYGKLDSLLEEVMKMLNKMISNLNSTN